MSTALLGLVLATGIVPPVAAQSSGIVEERGRVEQVIDGDTFKLTTGQRVRLDAVNALEIIHKPNDIDRCLPSLRQGSRCDMTLAEQARTRLQALLLGRELRLRLNPERREDRFGRWLAQVTVRDESTKEIDVAETLVREGLVHVYPLSGQEMNAQRLLVLENQARQERRGIWALPDLQVTPVSDALKQTGHYALFKGRVLEASKRKNRLYLNFGKDYRTDFTVMIDKKNWANFSQDPTMMVGKTILVRGFLHEDYGPAVLVTNPWQIEVVAR
jgi:micrococcal nuclease